MALDFAFPSGDVGPVLLRLLMRLALICLSVVIVVVSGAFGIRSIGRRAWPPRDIIVFAGAIVLEIRIAAWKDVGWVSAA